MPSTPAIPTQPAHEPRDQQQPACLPPNLGAEKPRASNALDTISAVSVSSENILPPLPRPCAVGIDSLYVSYYLDVLGIDWEELRYRKEQLAATPGAKHTEVEIGGERFALMRYGAKPYSFVLINKAFRLELGERIQPRCHAQIHSEVLWQLGLDGACERLNALWRKAGVKLLAPEVVFRVDAAFDFAIGEPDFHVDHFLSRSKKDCTWRESGELQSVQFGKSDVVVRAYDKVVEIEQQSEKSWFFELWGTTEGVWRFEFQLRGETLKAEGIATIAQMKAYLPGLVRRLAEEHTSLRLPGNDSNRSRWPVHPLWTALIEASNGLTIPPDRPPPPFKRGALYGIERQLQSLGGDLKGLAAALSRNAPGDPVSLDQLMKWLSRMMNRRIPPQLWKADVKAKIRKRELGL